MLSMCGVGAGGWGGDRKSGHGARIREMGCRASSAPLKRIHCTFESLGKSFTPSKPNVSL